MAVKIHIGWHGMAWHGMSCQFTLHAVRHDQAVAMAKSLLGGMPKAPIVTPRQSILKLVRIMIRI